MSHEEYWRERAEKAEAERDRWRKETFEMADWAGFQTNNLREARKLIAAVEDWHRAHAAVWTTRVHDGNEAHALDVAADNSTDALLDALRAWHAYELTLRVASEE